MRVERKNSPELQLAILLSIFVVFVADLWTPLGVAVWIFYILPLILSLSGWNPSMPIITACVTTVLTLIQFFLDSPGVTPSVAGVNRLFGIATIWTVSIIGRKFLLGKLLISEQNRLRTAQTGLAAGIQGDEQLPVLGQKILRFMSENLDAQVGLIYARTANGAFQRFASYALDSDGAAFREWVRPGEGIIGQALKDRRPLIVRDVPEGYVQVSSVLGGTKPRNILAVPAIAEGQVEAILELGFLRPVDSSDLKIFDLISEFVGTAVRAANYRSRLEEFLAETQQQSEELQVQSEELRVANEELEEQSRILRASQARLENQQAELEATNAQLEEHTQLLQAQKMQLSSAQQALAIRAAEVARVSQYKSEFLANMSHELRTPLNSSLILSKLLADNKHGNLTADQVKFAQTIYSAGNDLLVLINDILDLSRIEAGKVSVQPETISIAGICEGIFRTFQVQAEQKKLRLATQIDHDAPRSIVTDAQRLEQILKNLLSNALKFTDKGSVTLRVSPRDNDAVIFAVTDTGIGIPADQQGAIFEAFRQADGSTHRKYGGTGLGLSISRDLAILLGGELQLRSDAGTGSTFTLTLPLAFRGDRQVEKAIAAPAIPAVQAAATSTATANAPAGEQPAVVDDDRRQPRAAGVRTLLVIEDDERFARVLYDLAHELRFKCILAASAAEGLALAKEQSPHAIVLDVHLPDQSGLYVLDQLKRNPSTRHIPVHVVSVANYMSTALELGAVGYDLKPVKREELISALHKIEARLEQSVRRILIVEDDDRQRESLQRLLESPGNEITAVATAAETLEKLKESTFDCVVMDLGLEDMSGYELLDRMANEEAYSFPPVIIYTGRSLQPLDEQRLLRYSRSIIIKGARSPERLLDEVTLFLHQVESSLPPDQQRMLRLVRDRDAALEGRRVLVVEDDVRNIFAVTSILEPKGAEIVFARTGKEAIQALERSQSAGAIDLVLMDIMMPEMDGLTAMREIRSRGEWNKLPIIALTAKAMPDDRDQCVEAAANDYISKPLDVDKLLSLIRVWMPKS